MSATFDMSILKYFGDNPEDMLRCQHMLAEAWDRFEADLSVVRASFPNLTFAVTIAVGEEDEDAEGETEQGHEEGPTPEA